MEVQCGIMVSEIDFIGLPIIFKNAGMNFIIVDCEHGSFCERSLANLVMTAKLAGLQCLIRLPDNSRKHIIKYMDMGACGFVLPMTNAPEDILPLVRYAKYAPQGERGISTMRAHTLYNPTDLAEYMKKANSQTKLFAQIETRRGLEKAEEILRTDGIDGLFIGPNDLSCDLGCIGDKAPVLEAIEKMGKLANFGTIGIITGDDRYLRAAEQSGYSMFCKGSELNLLKNGATDTVRYLKNLGSNR